jgi:hypothetical protein
MMNARTQTDRAAALLESVKPELLKLLGGAPAFGSVGFELVFHGGELCRLISKMEISRKPRTGGIS